MARSADNRRRHRRRTKETGLRQERRSNKEFAVVTYLFLAIFLAWVIYFVWFMLFRAESILNNSYNARLDVYEEQVIRGSILAADGTVLAGTQVDDDGTSTRVYPYGSQFAHVVGYNTSNGSAGIESLANYYLVRSNEDTATQIIHDLTGEKDQGDSVVTTLNVAVQTAAEEALGSYYGAVVALDPQTGAILAMVSNPGYDPNTIEEDYETYADSDSTSSILVNRATQGLYAPGSTFKIFAILEYLEEHDYLNDYSYSCSGSITYGTQTIRCAGGSAHGTVDLISAFAESCNGAFVDIGLSIDQSAYVDLVNASLFNSSLPCEYTYNQSSFTLTADSDYAILMQTVIGQGETLVTPYHMALLSSAIANDGELMTPYILDHTENADGETVTEFETGVSYAQIFTQHQASALQELMEAVVSEGTASALSGKSYDAAGKTGTAQYSDGDSTHAWFIGYAEQDGKQIAIAVIVEDSGGGSTYAVPVAEAAFDAFFNE